MLGCGSESWSPDSHSSIILPDLNTACLDFAPASLQVKRSLEEACGCSVLTSAAICGTLLMHWVVEVLKKKGWTSRVEQTGHSAAAPEKMN